MAKKIYPKGNYLYIDDELNPIIRYPKKLCIFEKDTVNWVVKNLATGGALTLPIATVATWYEETGVTPYTEGTLDAIFESNTGA